MPLKSSGRLSQRKVIFVLNKVFLQGRLVADPELRHTPNGVPVASFRLAVDRDFKDKSTGERKADFINVIAWRQTGEFVSRYFFKGHMAVVEGKLQTRAYTDKDGNKRSSTEVLAEAVYFGESKKPEGRKEPRFEEPEFADMDDDGYDPPF